MEPELDEPPLNYQPRDLLAEANPSSLGRKNAEAERRAVIACVDPQPRTPNAFTGVLDTPFKAARLRMRAA